MAVESNPEKENGKKSGQVAWWQPAIAMFLKLSVWIAVPVIIALYLGKWLDNRYETDPWLFLTCIGLAFIVSMVGLIRSTLTEYKKIERDSKEQKD